MFVGFGAISNYRKFKISRPKHGNYFLFLKDYMGSNQDDKLNKTRQNMSQCPNFVSTSQRMQNTANRQISLFGEGLGKNQPKHYMDKKLHNSFNNCSGINSYRRPCVRTVYVKSCEESISKVDVNIL